MEGACRGAHEAGGQTVGILPGPDKAQANPYVTIPIVTDLGHARNVLIVRSSDVLVAISGCLWGMKCGRSASAVGAAVTSAVVAGMTWIVIASAMLTVIYSVLGW